MRRIISVFSIIFALSIGVTLASSAEGQGTPTGAVPLALKSRIEAALPAATGRGGSRFTLIALDVNGALTVIYKVEAEPTLTTLRDAAIADQLILLRAIFGRPPIASVRTATIVGTYAISKGASTRELPIVMATVTANRAQHIDWANVQPGQLPALVQVWWLHPALPSIAATPIATPVASPIGA